MHHISRRDILKAGVFTGLALTTPLAQAGDSNDKKASKKFNAQVAAVRGENLDAMTREVIDAVGG